MSNLSKYLLAHQLIKSKNAVISPLSGGVSSEIYLVKEGSNAFVVKKALPKLKVSADWYADIRRNDSEQAYIKYVHQFLPEAVPQILFSDPREGLFIMEYLGEKFDNWKSLLLKKRVDTEAIQEAARILGTIHRQSWNDPRAAATFNTTKNFYELRLEPYLLATAKKHPDLSHLLEQESARLSQTHQCLVHGDYSPKNILISPGRMVILDCEVAWYGDPAFDVAFFLNHLLLKSLHFIPDYLPFISQVPLFCDQYRTSLGHHYEEQQLEARIAHLLPMLLLARVDGKSPVEYLQDNHKQDYVRRFVKKQLMKTQRNLDALLLDWEKEILHV